MRPKPISRKRMTDRYASMLEYANALSMEHIRRTFDENSRYFGGTDPLRRKEMAFGGNVMEDRNAPANLPQQFIHRESKDRYASELSPWIDSVELD